MMEWFFARPVLSRTGYAGRVRKADYSDQFYRTFMDHRSVPVCEQRSAPHTARTHPTALLNDAQIAVNAVKIILTQNGVK